MYVRTSAYGAHCRSLDVHKCTSIALMLNIMQLSTGSLRTPS